ncbi:hypothetical protein Tco_1507874 [Tanacetum coccineum]
MTTPVEKRNANKFCEFHGEVGHNTDECNHLRKQIEDMLKARKTVAYNPGVEAKQRKRTAKKESKTEDNSKVSHPTRDTIPPLGNEKDMNAPK